MPSAVVLGRDDRCVNMEWAVPAAIVAVGEPPVLLAGGHSPFLSRPGGAGRRARCGGGALSGLLHAEPAKVKPVHSGQSGSGTSKPTGVPQWLRNDTSCTGRRAAIPHRPVG